MTNSSLFRSGRQGPCSMDPNDHLPAIPSTVVDIRSPHDPAHSKYAISEHGRRGTVVLQLWSTGRGVVGLSILAPGGLTFTHDHLQALHGALSGIPSMGRGGRRPARALLLTDSLISIRPLLPTRIDCATEAVRSSLLTLPDLLAQWSARYGPSGPGSTVQDPDIHRAEDGYWYFWDETQANRHGPYSTRDRAQEAIKAYGEWLTHGGESKPEHRPDVGAPHIDYREDATHG